MNSYPKNTVYFIAYAKLPTTISASKVMDVVGVGLVINYETGEIIDTSCTLITQEARDFIKSIIIGHNLHTEPIECLIDQIIFRFHGLSQKAIAVAVKGAYERYIVWKNNIE